MHPDSAAYDEPTSVRDRVYGQATLSADGRRSFVAVLLAIAIFSLIISVSCRQVTAPAAGRDILESGIVALTDIDQFIADDGPALRQAALENDDPVLAIPDFPVDLVLAREEVVNSSDEQLRKVLLERSSALVYAEGLDAFDRTGDQSLRRFSLQGILEFGVAQVSQSSHDRATLFAVVSALACALLGAVVAGSASGWDRMRALGIAATAGAVPAVLLFLGLRFVAGALAGEDPFQETISDITQSSLAVPLRNGLIVMAMGAVVVGASMGLARLERMAKGPAPVTEDDERLRD